MIKPLKDIPLNLVIESLTNHKIIPFNPNDENDKEILSDLTKAAQIAGSNINRNGIARKRPNEVGNDIEPFVKQALITLGYKASTPITTEGKRKATGYPDIEFIDKFGRKSYLECKTYNIETISTTLRAFYMSPSKESKITTDAHHLVISFEIYVDGRVGNKNIYRCKKWKILSIEDLSVDVKYEFNSDNRRLYSTEMILAEGALE